MVPKPVAFALLAVACLAAAAGGAYIASLQESGGSKPPAVGQVTDGGQGVVEGAAQSSAVSAGRREIGEQVQTPGAGPAPSRPAAPDPRYAVKAPPAETRGGRSARGAVGREAASAPPARRQATGPAKPNAADAGEPVEQRPSAAAAGSLASPEGEQKGLNGPPAPPEAGGVASSAAPGEVSSPALPPLAESPQRQRTLDEIVVPALSVLGLSLETPLSSEQSRVEDRVEARVTRDVMVDGKVAIPAGTRAIGSVTIVERGGKVKDRARLAFRFHTLRLPDDTEVAVSTEAIYREGDEIGRRNTAKIGGAAVGGAIIGAILGGGKGAAIGGSIGAAGGAATVMAGDRQTVVLRAGMPLSVRTEAPVTVTVER